MKNLLIGTLLAVLAAGSAYAIESGRLPGDADGDGVLTQAEAKALFAQELYVLRHHGDAKPLAPAN